MKGSAKGLPPGVAGCKLVAMPITDAPQIISSDEAVHRLQALDRPWAVDYLAMYSSWWDGIIAEPWLMTVPLDDHLVHRGDGVFEVSKCIGGRIYQFDRHLKRLTQSAQAVHLDLPAGLDEIKRIAVAVAAAGGRSECMVRIYCSRGPGGFTTNPFECPQPGLYVQAGVLHPMADEDYEQGVSIGVSQVPVKSGFFASVKCCNYLPNVLLKREAVINGWNFAIGLDEAGHLAEGSTENFGLVDGDNRLLLPPPGNILEGTTARRAVELAQGMVDEGLLAEVTRSTLDINDLESASEVMLFGTTLDILPATRLGDSPVGDGRVGPVAKELLARMRHDIAHNPEASTLVE